MVLELDESATIKDVKLAYYKKAKLYHPDSNYNTNIKNKCEAFKEVSEAYECLSLFLSKKDEINGRQIHNRQCNNRNCNWPPFYDHDREEFEREKTEWYKE